MNKKQKRLKKEKINKLKNKNQYCELIIIIGKDHSNNYAHFESKNVTSVEHAFLFKYFQKFIEDMKQEDSLAYELYKAMETDEEEKK